MTANPVAYDSDAGRLRTTPDLLDHALRTRTGSGSDQGYPEAYIAVGAIADGEPDPPLAAAFDAIAESVCELDVVVARAAGLTHHHGWLSYDVAAMLLQVDDEVVDLIALAPEFIATAIYYMVDLGPIAPLPAGSVSVPASAVERLMSEEHHEREAGLAELRDASPAEWRTWFDDFDTEGWCAFQARMLWPDTNGQLTGSLMQVIMNSEGGLAAAPGQGEEIVLSPTSATDLWAQFIALLPPGPPEASAD